MKATATDTTLDCGCTVTQYDIEDKDRNLVATIKHTTPIAECTAGHKPRFGLASAWTRRAIATDKPKKGKVTVAPPVDPA